VDVDVFVRLDAQVAAAAFNTQKKRYRKKTNPPAAQLTVKNGKRRRPLNVCVSWTACSTKFSKNHQGKMHV
jgi:hypothetical protein